VRHELFMVTVAPGPVTPGPVAPGSSCGIGSHWHVSNSVTVTSHESQAPRTVGFRAAPPGPTAAAGLRVGETELPVTVFAGVFKLLNY
jgi:hypothetical protein